MEQIDKYFTIDEIVESLGKVVDSIGLKVSRKSRNHVPGICKEGKRETFHEVWEVKSDKDVEYLVEFVGEDTHLRKARGRDSYQTRLLDKKRKVLLETVSEYTNVPDSVTDLDEDVDGETPSPARYGTTLLTNEPIANALYRSLLDRIKQPEPIRIPA
ncbi:hypothetical protein GOV12_02390 [Candidatus Pacearchaeota archaeon]|nr:hypothetical protein [Candidatus Pacearchaeota archaeon]